MLLHGSFSQESDQALVLNCGPELNTAIMVDKRVIPVRAAWEEEENNATK